MFSRQVQKAYWEDLRLWQAALDSCTPQDNQAVEEQKVTGSPNLIFIGMNNLVEN